MTESYGACLQAISLLEAIGRQRDASSPAAATPAARACANDADAALTPGGPTFPNGRGAVILDVCCGRGMTGVLLSYLLPEATIVLFDSNGGMDLRHVAARPNVRFRQLDIFAAEALQLMEEAAAGIAAESTATATAAAALDGSTASGGTGAATACVAIGTHLCGALSPRLIDVALRIPSIHGLILSPCCLRGALGSNISRTARRAAKSRAKVLKVDGEGGGDEGGGRGAPPAFAATARGTTARTPFWWRRSPRYVAVSWGWPLGSAASIYLPIHLSIRRPWAASSVAAETRRPKEPSAHHATRRIRWEEELLVDDHPRRAPRVQRLRRGRRRCACYTMQRYCRRPTPSLLSGRRRR